MANYGKWLGAGLGWAFLGPIGALIGFGFGSIIDSMAITDADIPKRQTTTRGDFMLSLLVLVAAVMKADGKVVKSELDYVKSFLVRQFGTEATSEAMLLLRDMLKQPIPLKDVSDQIKSKMDYSSRLQLLHLLFGVSNADGKIPESELNILKTIHIYLAISTADYESIKSMFIKDVDAAYKILEITPQATNEEIKKAYRKMAVKYHPDKVSYLGDDLRKDAEKKFQKINEAYNQIKNERGI